MICEIACVSVFFFCDQISLVSIINDIESSSDIVCWRGSDAWIGIHICHIDLILVDEIWVLCFGKTHQVELILLFLFFKSLHGRVHVNSEGYDDIEANDDAKVVKYDEEVADPQVTALNVDAHCHNDIPIIHYDQDEKSDIRGHQVVEVDEVVVVWYGLIVENFTWITCYQTAEYKHSPLSEYIENRQHDERQVVNGTQ